MSKKVISVALAALMMAGTAGCGLGSSVSSSAPEQTTAPQESTAAPAGGESSTAASTAEMTIKVSNGASESSPGVQAQRSTFKPMVEEASGGKIAVEVYFGNQLGDDTKATEAVRAGDLECNNTSTAPLVGLVPELAIFDIPFLFTSPEVADKVIDGEIGNMLNEKLEAKGVYNLAWNENGFRDLTNSKKTVRSPEDLAGLKIRTMENQFHLEAWKALGANPTPMSWSEVFTALQQGTIDGQENPIPNFYSARIQEVNKHITRTGHIYSPFLLLYSKQIFDTYDADTQKIIRDAAAAYGVEERRLNREETDAKAQALVDEGCEVIELTPEEKKAFQDKTASVWDSVGKKVGDDMITQLKAAVAEAEK